MNGWSWYWLIWFMASFALFIVPESIALATHHVENTLSAQVWRLEGLQNGQPIWQWTALHVLVGGALAVVLLWLVGHFVLGFWR